MFFFIYKVFKMKKISLRAMKTGPRECSRNIIGNGGNTHHYQGQQRKQRSKMTLKQNLKETVKK